MIRLRELLESDDKKRLVVVRGCCVPSGLEAIEEGSETLDMKYNLNTVFDEVNHKYFSGQLKPVPLKWNRQTRTLGLVKSRMIGNRGNVESASILSLQITKAFHLTHEQFMSTFIHECIHVYMLQNASSVSWMGGYHGYYFKKMAKELSNKSGFSITTSHDEDVGGELVANTEMQRKKTATPFHLMIQVSEDGKFIDAFSITRNTQNRNGFTKDDKSYLGLLAGQFKYSVWRLYSNVDANDFPKLEAFQMSRKLTGVGFFSAATLRTKGIDIKTTIEAIQKKYGSRYDEWHWGMSGENDD